jgi:hypothetical protein
VRTGLVASVASQEDHVDDRIELGVEEYLERTFGVGLELGRDLVDRDRGRGGSRHVFSFSAVAGSGFAIADGKAAATAPRH